jgi:hypothetical protein
MSCAPDDREPGVDLGVVAEGAIDFLRRLGGGDRFVPSASSVQAAVAAGEPAAC